MTAAAPSPREMLERLVAFDTTSRESNLALIHDVRDYLDSYGIVSSLVFDATGRKANLFATIGPERDGGVVLSGHTDVVPVDGQDWHSDPFRAVARDGRLYGRGTADMKGFIATCLSLVPAFQAADLQRPLHFAFSYDEEIGCVGVHGLVRHLAGLPFRPRAVIVGEPTEMRVFNAHKGACGVDTRFVGLEAHSSAEHVGVNAIVYMSRLVCFLADLQAELRDSGARDPRFEPPYTTIDIGRADGGTARNIIPREAKLAWGFRALPQEDDDRIIDRVQAYIDDVLLPDMRRRFPGAAIESAVSARAPGLATVADSPAETLALSIAGANDTSVASYCTEAGIFQQAGVPAVICGPGNIREAHRPDEYVELDQLDQCAAFLRRLAGRLAA